VPVEAGDPAPAFQLPDQDGKPVRSEDLRGHPYVLYFYPGDDTPGCTTEACQFNDNLTAFQDANVPVVGVSPDDQASHQKFRSKYGLRFTLLSDPEKRVLEAYGAWGERPGRGPGVIRSTFLVGEDGVVRKAWHAVKADGHAQEVLTALGQS
jgi:peroxiredoxin Q/BCP